jgi:diguanylate cyclase (GGDEF)-like protein
MSLIVGTLVNIPVNSAAIIYDLNLLSVAMLLSAILYYYSRVTTRSEIILINTAREYAVQADTDQLTNLNNRRSMQRYLKHAIIDASHYQQPFVIAMIDVDDFKAINDHHGHAVGDEVLKHIAKILTSHLRDEDTVSRWGGEEFLVLLKYSSESAGERAINKIRKIIQSESIIIHDRIIRTTITAGISQYDSRLDINFCIEQADKALYSGKKRGKNCVIAVSDMN